MHVKAVGPPPGRLQARVVDAIEEVLEGAGHIADIGGGAEEIAVRLEHIGGRRRQGGPDDHLDALDLIGPCSGDRRLKHFLQGGRRRVMNDQQPRHDR
jgi:hypothetical protein